MEIKNSDAFEMTFENRYKVFSIEKRAKYIDELYEPYKVRGLVLKNSPKYQYSDVREEGYIISQGFDENGYYRIFLPTENEYEKIKIFAEIKDKLVKLSELANLQRQLTARNKTYSELNSIQKKIDELYVDIFGNKTIDTTRDFSDNSKNEKSKNDIDKHWFIVGLSFADGTIQKLYRELKSGAKIAIYLGNRNYRPYITETKGNSTSSDKNIYCSFKKMKIIFDYCIEQKIEICDEFRSVYDEIKPH